jgi:hypothetical protein
MSGRTEIDMVRFLGYVIRYGLSVLGYPLWYAPSTGQLRVGRSTDAYPIHFDLLYRHGVALRQEHRSLSLSEVVCFSNADTTTSHISIQPTLFTWMRRASRSVPYINGYCDVAGLGSHNINYSDVSPRRMLHKRRCR